MKGQFEITEEMLKDLYQHHNLSEGEVVNVMLKQQMEHAGLSERERLVIGWYARRTNPITGNKTYLWDTTIHHKLGNSKYNDYFRELKSDGWEIPYNILKL